MTRPLKSKLLIPLLAISLTACATTENSDIPVKITSISSTQEITYNYRPVPKKRFVIEEDKIKWVDEVNAFYPDGFLRIGFSSTENLEKIIIDGVYTGSGYSLKVCETDYEASLPTYGAEIFRLNPDVNDITAPYYIFVPNNLESAISGSVGGTEIIGKGELELPQDLRDLCVFIRAYKYWGSPIYLDLGSINEISNRKL